MPKPTALLACFLAISAASSLAAQSPAVQQLYQKAHADQQAGRSEQAIADYRELLRLDPSIAAAYNNLGRLYFTLNRFPEAVATLEKGLALQPDMAPASIMLGASYLQLDEAQKAVTPLEAGVTALPDDRFARLSLVRAYAGLNRREDAVAQLQQLLQRDPRDQESWYLLGKLQLEQSQASLAKVQTLNPDSPLAHQLSAEVMESMKNMPGAVAEYKRALAIAPDDLDAQSHLANLYWTTGDWNQARPLLVSYLEKRPADCIARWKLGNTLSQLESPPEDVLREIDRALKQCPDLAQARVDRARMLLKTGDAKEALPELKAAEIKAPDEPSIQFLLARVYKALGDPAAATAAAARFEALQKAEHAASEKHAADVLNANQ